MRAEAAVVGGLTLAELIHDIAAIDPRVVAAADRSRAEALNDVFGFGRFAEGVGDLSDAARAGAENSLLGHVAEIFVADRLRHHDVEFPITPNNPGYDLLIDGQPFQVKCYADGVTAVEALEAHFSRYPDTPVFINSEVQPALEASDAPWADRVFYVDGYDYGSVKAIMDESLAAGADLADLSGPIFATAFVLGRKMYRWHRGSIPLRDLPMEMVLDGSVHGTLAVAGSVAGKLVGAVLFGPAGAVILGSAGGPAALLGSRRVRQAVDKRLMGSWLRDVEAANADFRLALTEAMRRKIVRNYERIDHLGGLPDPLRASLRLTFEDRALAVAECMADLRDQQQDPVEDAEASLRLMRDADVHAGAVREALGRLTRILAARPAAASGLRAIAAPVLQGAAGLASSGVDALRRAGSKDR